MTDSLYPYPESSLEHRHLLLPPPPPPPLHMCKRETRGGGTGYDTAALTFPSPPFRVHTLNIPWQERGGVKNLFFLARGGGTHGRRKRQENAGERIIVKVNLTEKCNVKKKDTFDAQ